LPPGRKVIPLKWVFTRKIQPNESSAEIRQYKDLCREKAWTSTRKVSINHIFDYDYSKIRFKELYQIDMVAAFVTPDAEEEI